MDDGKLSLDMLIGISIFLFTFIFIAQFLPSVFVSTRGEISLAHEAYKIAVLLSENEGKWSNGTTNGTDWENHWNETNVVFLPGLAAETNCLSYGKIAALRNAINSDYTKIERMLGLITPDSIRNFRVSLEMINSTPYKRVLLKDDDGNIVLDAGGMPTGQVSRFERIVWIDTIRNLTHMINVSPTNPNDVHVTNLVFTYPVNVLVISINNYITNPPPPAWVDVLVGVPPGSSPNDEVVSFSGSEGLGLHDLTPTINSFLKSKGFQEGDKVNVKIRVKNFRGEIFTSDTLDLISGRPVAKLVVAVW